MYKLIKYTIYITANNVYGSHDSALNVLFIHGKRLIFSADNATFFNHISCGDIHGILLCADFLHPQAHARQHRKKGRLIAAPFNMYAYL